MERLYFTLLTGVIAAPFMYLGLCAMDSYLCDRLETQRKIIPLPKAAVILNKAGFTIIFHLVGEALTGITGNEIFFLLAKSVPSLGMGVMFLAVANVCGRKTG